MSWLRIGQMATMNGITEEALRYYDNIGLLKPCHIDPDTGYRFYDIAQSTKLDLIQYMKSLGMQLCEIKKQLDACDMNYIRESLEKHSAAIDVEIQKLSKQKGSVERAIESYEKLKNHPPVGMTVLEHMQRRYLYSLDVEEELYLDDNGEGYELGQRRLRAKMQQSNLPYSFFSNAGIIVREENFRQGRLNSTEVFAFVDPVYAGYAGIETVPAATFLSIYCDHINQEPECFQFLLDEIGNSGYEVAGDYICEEIAAIPIIKGNHRDILYRLQVPVIFPRKQQQID